MYPFRLLEKPVHLHVNYTVEQHGKRALMNTGKSPALQAVAFHSVVPDLTLLLVTTLNDIEEIGGACYAMQSEVIKIDQ
ncbi:hypothetical protein D3C80_2157060 [compost metagenome]